MTEPTKNPIEAARQAADHAVKLAKLELELKLTELRGKALRLGMGAGLAVLALLLAPLVVVFALASLAAGLATVVSVWLAILIVGGILLLLVVVLLGVAVTLLKGVSNGG